MPVPFSTDLVSPAAISLQGLQPTSCLGVAAFCREAFLSNSFLALIALEQHQDVIVLFSHVLWKMTTKCVNFLLASFAFCLQALPSVKWLSFKGTKCLHQGAEWNPGLTPINKNSAIDFMGPCQVSSLHKTWVDSGRLQEDTHLCCVFLPLQQQDLLQNKNTVMASGKNKVQNHTQWKPPTLFW